jgi:diaminopimelate epimerase
VTHAGGELVSLTKHEGAGNDFLVLLAPSGRPPLDGATVARLCDRHRGVGADGLIWVGPGRDGAALSMVLRNADGGEAEMSGNGMRCLAQAAVEGGLVAGPRFTVATASGVRAVEFLPAESAGVAWASVDMAPPEVGGEPAPPVGFTRAAEVDVGNPHLVLLADDVTALGAGALDLAALAKSVEPGYPAGINVEVIAPGAHADELVLRVFERGAGETLACGTGSVAAAAAAARWGLVGGRVVVHNPGGALEVTLANDGAALPRLAGPVRKVADVVVDLGAFG